MTVSSPPAPSEQPAPGAEVLPVASVLRQRWDALRSGELGSWPIVVGIVAITIFFYEKSSIYVGSANFNNLIVQLAPVAVIAFGVVFVLLLGEIDLSIGSVSGVAGVVVAELQLPGSGHQLPGVIAILLAVATGAAIGAFQGSVVAFLGVPSFVVTLAGLLAFQGVILRSLPQSVIGIQNTTVNDIESYYFSHRAGWIIAGVAAALYAATELTTVVSRWRARIKVGNLPFVIVKILAVTAIASKSRSPELTAEWEFKLAQMEHGNLRRDSFMREIVDMTHHIVAQAKNHESDTIPGDFATLQVPCPTTVLTGQPIFRSIPAKLPSSPLAISCAVL